MVKPQPVAVQEIERRLFGADAVASVCVGVDVVTPEIAVVTLRLDPGGFARCKALIERASALAETDPAFADRLAGLMQSGDKLVDLGPECRSAASASDLVVAFEPSEGFARLMAASGAGDV